MRNVLVAATLLLAGCTTTPEQARYLDAYQEYLSPGARGTMSMSQMRAMGYIGPDRRLEDPAYPGGPAFVTRPTTR